MLFDYHVHCEFSDDSEELMEDQIEKAIEKGVEEICFTDHVDYGIKRDVDDPRGIEIKHAIEHGKEVDIVLANVNYPVYFEKLHAMQKTYAGRIAVKQGLEFGIQSVTVQEYQKLYDTYKNELDFILFSMHQVDNLEFWTQDFQRGKTQKEYNEAYYVEIHKTMGMSGRPEVAFAGKSNVGKSSLINGLMNRKALARTSAQPGHHVSSKSPLV